MKKLQPSYAVKERVKNGSIFFLMDSTLIKKCMSKNRAAFLRARTCRQTNGKRSISIFAKFIFIYFGSHDFMTSESVNSNIFVKC